MRAELILQRRLASVTAELDIRWWRSIWDAVGAALRGRVLQLTRLGRHSSRPTSQKHRIKAMDRLLGSQCVFEAVTALYRGLARVLITLQKVPIIVDWTQIRGDRYAIVAAIPLGGRAVPILARVHAHARRPSRRMHRQFLAELAEVLPPASSPILVTDAGFQGSWMQDVAARGWGYVARLRHRTCVRQAGGAWMPNKTLHANAGRIPRDLGDWEIGRDRARNRTSARLVLARTPRRHRHRRGRSGKVLRGGISVTLRAQHREPWLLATNCKDGAEQIVALYRTRMQIEETFRDTKSSQLGLALEQSRSTSAARLTVLLLVATLGLVTALLVGLAGRTAGIHRKLQANTSSKPVLSVFQVGLLILTTAVGRVLRPSDLRRGLRTLILQLGYS